MKKTNWNRSGAKTRFEMLRASLPHGTLVAVVSLGCFLATVALGQPPPKEPAFGKWHRLNPRLDGVSPEHQVLHLRRPAGTWEGTIDKHPEPDLGFENPPLGDRVNFSGLEITNSEQVACLDGFPFDCPDGVTQALDGTSVVVLPPEGERYTFPTQWIVGAGKVLWNVLLFSKAFPGAPNVACPWFRTFDEALAANPFPLPFNGADFPEHDCLMDFP